MQKSFLKRAIYFVLIFVFSGLFLVNIGKAEANPGILEDAAKSLLQGVTSVALHIAQAFTGFVGNIFKGIVDFGFQQMDMVKMGWTITRDIVNMFFILALVVIAFATILRIETYGIKTLLPKLILIALLINFSYVICGVIIDATQITAAYFVKQIETEDIAIAVLSRLRVIDAIRSTEGQMVPITDYDTDMVLILTTAFSAIVVFVAGFVMLVGAILLFIRVGALWALIILSPFAWFFSVFPGKLKGYANQWWESFLKWAFFAPIYIFFIFLVLKISEAGVLEGMGLATGETAVGLASLTLVPMFGDLNILFRYVFLIILLFGAPIIATSMGIKSAGAAQKFVKGALKGTTGAVYKGARGFRETMAGAPPKWMTKMPVVKQVRTGLQKAAIWTSPQYWKTALEARKAERMRRAGIPEAIGKMQKVANVLLSWSTDKTDYAEQAHQFEAEEEGKRMMLRTKGNANAVIKEMAATKDRNVLDAGFLILARNNDFNDFCQSEEFGDRNLSYPDAKGNPIPINRTFSREAFVDLFYQLQKGIGVTERKASSFLANIQEQALSAGTNFYGAVSMDEKGWKRNSVDGMNEISARKAITIDSRKFSQTVHPMSWVRLNQKNDYDGWDEGAMKKFFEHSSPGAMKSYDLTRSRPDLITKAANDKAVDDLRKIAKTLTGRMKETAEALAINLEAAKEGKRVGGKGGGSPKASGVLQAETEKEMGEKGVA